MTCKQESLGTLALLDDNDDPADEPELVGHTQRKTHPEKPPCKPNRSHSH